MNPQSVNRRPAHGWAFVIARGYQTGYQLLLAPEFLARGAGSAVLMSQVSGEVPADGPPRVVGVATPEAEPLVIVYRSAPLTRADVGDADPPDAPLLDRAGRPLLLTYGFVARGLGLPSVDELDLRTARDAAAATYRRFHAAELDFQPEVSTPYPLRSRTAPAPRAVAQPAAATPAATWSTDPLSARSPAAGPRVPGRQRRLLIGAAAAVAALAATMLVATAVSGPDTVAVPDVVNHQEAEAVKAISGAGLVPVVVVGDGVGTGGATAIGVVLTTDPPAGSRVPKQSKVQLWVRRVAAPVHTGPMRGL